MWVRPRLHEVAESRRAFDLCRGERSAPPTAAAADLAAGALAGEGRCADAESRRARGPFSRGGGVPADAPRDGSAGRDAR